MISKAGRTSRISITLFVFCTQLFFTSVSAQTNDRLALLVPDEIPLSDPRVQAWVDAAQEEGILLTTIRDEEFLSDGGDVSRYPGVILPDQIHDRASDALIGKVRDYVAQGGKAMLVFDFGVLDDRGFYPVDDPSRLSDLAGVRYNFFNEFYNGKIPSTVGLGPVTGMASRLRRLGVPPGKSMAYAAPAAHPELAGIESANQTDTEETALYLPSSPSDPGGLKGYDASYYHKVKIEAKDKGAPPKQPNIIKAPKVPTDTYVSAATAPEDALHGVSGYYYGFLTYPSYLTRGEYKGDVILASPEFGLVAGYQQYGKGGVLFVNLPLSYLKGATDGMLLHGFLNYFGADVLAMAHLSNHPRGIGGLVLNWHVDAAEALDPMEQLKKLKVWDEGPFSIHITAGPDVDMFGDGLGLDVPGNKVTQEWIRYFESKKHQVGSHGGWIHNYFGQNASEDNGLEFVKYLIWNRDAIRSVLKKQQVIEYSAPEGNNPPWAVHWLANPVSERNQPDGPPIVGYYFTGHTGMGPTRAYRNAVLSEDDKNLWAFPLTPFGDAATFEEFYEMGMSGSEVTQWFTQLADFCMQYHTSRLIYFHPPGAVLYPDVVQGLLAYAKSWEKFKRFQWHTMADLANFNMQRLKTSWRVDTLPEGDKLFVAAHPTSLVDQTWLLPKKGFAAPAVVKGDAFIDQDSENWLVIAKGVGNKSLTFKARPLAGI